MNILGIYFCSFFGGVVSSALWAVVPLLLPSTRGLWHHHCDCSYCWYNSFSQDWFWFCLRVSSLHECKQSPFPIMLYYCFRALFYFSFSLFFYCHICLFFNHDPDILTSKCSFQTATPSLKTRTEWCRSRRSSEPTTPPSRGPASGEPAGQPPAARQDFDGEELTCTCAPAAEAGFLHVDVKGIEESDIKLS